MVFDLNSDDYLGVCEPHNKYPLINAIKNEIARKAQLRSLKQKNKITIF